MIPSWPSSLTRIRPLSVHIDLLTGIFSEHFFSKALRVGVRNSVMVVPVFFRNLFLRNTKSLNLSFENFTNRGLGLLGSGEVDLFLGSIRFTFTMFSLMISVTLLSSLILSLHSLINASVSVPESEGKLFITM